MSYLYACNCSYETDCTATIMYELVTCTTLKAGLSVNVVDCDYRS